jgi:hypothetical protein
MLNSLVEIGSSSARSQWSNMVAKGAVAKALLTGDLDSELDLSRELWSGRSIEPEMVLDCIYTRCQQKRYPLYSAT